jgi:hypothetical protein
LDQETLSTWSLAMELVLLVAAATALALYAHQHPPRSGGPLDPYTAWLIRQQKPALHR